LASPVAPVAHDLDDDVDAERGAERHPERQGVVVLERLADDVREACRVGGPDGDGDGDPAEEPSGRLARDAGRDGEDGAPAGDEPRRDQQEAAACPDLRLRPIEASAELLAARGPAFEPPGEATADQVGGGIAEERATGATRDHHPQ
jgi:hypothetical protein